jgi:hypothetical protein
MIQNLYDSKVVWNRYGKKTCVIADQTAEWTVVRI